MLSPTLDTIRLFLHVLAAGIWVGGQIVLVGLVPGLRQVSPDATRIAARRFNRIAWPAFGVAVVTGMWGIFDIDVAGTTTSYQVTLGIKILAVTLSGLAAAAHTVGQTKVVLAVGGALGLLGGLGALFLGVLLRSGT